MSMSFSKPDTSFNQYTGWGDYVDTQYVDLSPWNPSVGTWNDVPNNAGVKNETQIPIDVSTFYDPVSGKILGRNGDGVSITIEFIARPTTLATTFVEVAFFIGGGLGTLGDGRIYQRTISFPRGRGVIKPESFNVDTYMLGTWQANGAILQVNPSAAVDIFKIRYVITRTHKAR